MTARELYEIWAPETSVWTRWAKPVLFAEIGMGTVAMPPSLVGSPAAQIGDIGEIPVLSMVPTAVVVELPALQAVEAGLALARAGFRPVPLFNGAIDSNPAIDVRPALQRLIEGAEILSRLSLLPTAPPAFLLDVERTAPRKPAGPGVFDNRWLTFPQDFPSASFLLSQQIRRVVVLTQDGSGNFAEDLAHVLLRYQEASLPILAAGIGRDPELVTVKRPSRFRHLWYRSLALAGLKRNSAGGFGAAIPIVAASTGGFG